MQTRLNPEVRVPPIIRVTSGRPCLGLGGGVRQELIDPVGSRDRAIGGALNGNGLVQAWARQPPAKPGQNGLIDADQLGEVTPGDVLGFEV